MSNYIEPVTRFGGIFLSNNELPRFILKTSRYGVAVDIIDEPPLWNTYRNCCTDNVCYLKANMESFFFGNLLNESFFDLVFINGDHSYEDASCDAQSTFCLLHIQVLHDIKSAMVLGVGEFWRKYKLANTSTHYLVKFVEQYESVDGEFRGIGVAVRKQWKKQSKLKTFLNQSRGQMCLSLLAKY